MKPITVAAWILAAGMGWLDVAAADEPSPVVAFSAGDGKVVVSRGGEDYLRLGLIAWGPNWAWTGIGGPTQGAQGVTTGHLQGEMGGTGVSFGIDFRASRPTARQIALQYDLQAEADTDLTLLVVELAPGTTFHGRDVQVTASGVEKAVPCPFERRGLGESVETVRLTDAGGDAAVLHFDPPCTIQSDGPARIVLAEGRLEGGKRRSQRITVDLPADVQWYASVNDIPDPPGMADWYAWEATGDTQDSSLSMADWLDRPAGRQGRIARKDDQLLYAGRPIKLWGLNLCYGACAPEKPLAERRAAFYPKYGINAVRLHKFADGAGWAGIQSAESCVEYDPEGLDRMDYQVAQLKQAGVYIELSAHFGSLKLGPADRKYVPYLEEFGQFQGEPGRIETPHSAAHYSPELQKVQALQIVNLLKHKNPYTGLTYAEDPAIAFVEIINEQSVFFYTSMGPLKASATLRGQVGARFCEWLRKKYGTEAKLLAAWGDRALNSFQGEGFSDPESLEAGTILPLGNPWFWDPDQLAGSQAFQRQRLLDTLEFLYVLQCEFFDGYVQAVRGAGYAGEIVGSNWQAGRAMSHFANLHSDYRVGTIDRHNYFGDSRPDATMLSQAGSGMLSSGMQQVADRPFMLSEWIHVFPNQQGVEGPAILGAYGMGLQGWDASFMFQNGDHGAFLDRLGRDQWEVSAPQVLGVFPAVARQVYRGDARQAELEAVRKVHVASLFEGKLGFDDRVAQGYDAKQFDSSAVSARSLAVARCVVAFTPTVEETPSFDLRPFERDGSLLSSTKQLLWTEKGDSGPGYFLMNTPGTKAVVGFAPRKGFRLGEVTIEPECPFAAIYVTARDRAGTVAGSRELLVVAMARARNTGMKLSPDGSMLLAAGEGPIRMEPVKARLTIRRAGTPQVVLLDHDGRATDKTLPVTEDGVIQLDGARDRTPYYRIRWP